MRRVTAARLASLSLASLVAAVAACGPRASRFAVDTAHARADLAIIGVRVLPMTGTEAVLHDQTILITGDRIVAVGPARSTGVPPGATRIEGRDRWVIPGLVDMHVHLSGTTAELDLPLYLANGITTIRNLFGAAHHIAMRERVAAGELTGPTILTSGRFANELHSGDDVARYADEHIERGFDFIKVHHHAMPLERYLEVTRAARERGLPVVGHLPVAVPLETAVQEGHRTFEHAENLLQSFFRMRPDSSRLADLASALKSGDGRACVVPTLIVFEKVVRQTEEFPHLASLLARPELAYVRAELRDAWHPERNNYVRNWLGREDQVSAAAATFRSQLEFMKVITRALHQHGVPLAAGSDAGVAFTLPGYSLIEELELLRQLGMTPHEVLASATRTAAACMDRADEFGSVAQGMRADLLILERDPIIDPAAAVKEHAGVVLRGRWLPRAELQRMLEQPQSR